MAALTRPVVKKKLLLPLQTMDVCFQRYVIRPRQIVTMWLARIRRLFKAFKAFKTPEQPSKRRRMQQQQQHLLLVFILLLTSQVYPFIHRRETLSLNPFIATLQNINHSQWLHLFQRHKRHQSRYVNPLMRKNVAMHLRYPIVPLSAKTVYAPQSISSSMFRQNLPHRQ